MKYSSNARRYKARSVDGVVGVGLFILVGAVAAHLAEAYVSELPREYFSGMAVLALGTSFFLYVIMPLKLYGCTWGMRLFGQKLVAVDGRPLSWLKVCAREAFSVVSVFVYGFGYWSALWHDKNQTWHDRWAGTVVIDSED